MYSTRVAYSTYVSPPIDCTPALAFGIPLDTPDGLWENYSQSLI